MTNLHLRNLEICLAQMELGILVKREQHDTKCAIFSFYEMMLPQKKKKFKKLVH